MNTTPKYQQQEDAGVFVPVAGHPSQPQAGHDASSAGQGGSAGSFAQPSAGVGGQMVLPIGGVGGEAGQMAGVGGSTQPAAGNGAAGQAGAPEAGSGGTVGGGGGMGGTSAGSSGSGGTGGNNGFIDPLKFVPIIPLSLSATTVVEGSRVTGRVTYRNENAVPIVVRNLIITLRRPGTTHISGPFYDMTPARTNVVVLPQATITLNASEVLPTGFLGAWEAYSTFSLDGMAFFDDSSKTLNVNSDIDAG